MEKKDQATLWAGIIATLTLAGGLVVQIVNETAVSSVLAVGLGLVLTLAVVCWWQQRQARLARKS